MNNEINNMIEKSYSREELDNIIATSSNTTTSTSLATGITTGNYINYPTQYDKTYNNRTDRNFNMHTFTNIGDLYPNYMETTPTIIGMRITKDMNKTINALMKIKDVEIIVPNKVVKVVFEDDTFEKAICHEDDKFSLETAITICIAKHMLGGSAKFNNILSKGVKLYNNKIKAEEEAKKKQERLEAKWKKQRERKMLRLAKKEEEARNARIQELAEAIRLANEYENNVANDDLGLYNYNEE